MRIPTLLIFSLLVQTVLFGQFHLSDKWKELSIRYENKELKDTAFINALNRLAHAYKDAHADSVIIIQKKTLELSKKKAYIRGEAEASRLMANAYENIRLYDEAMQYYNIALQLSVNERLKDIECRVLNNIGGLNTHRGNYSEAQEKFYAALKLAEKEDDKIMIGTILNNLANLFFFRDQFDEAQKFYQQTLELAHEINDSIGMGYACNNLGELYLINKDYAKALAKLELARAIGKRTMIREIILASTVNVAKVYTELDSTKLADEMFKEAIELSNRFGDSYHLANALLGLATLRYKTRQMEEARQLAEESTKLASQIGQNQLTRDGHALLADIYEAQEYGLLALKNLRLAQLYADSLNNIESARTAATMQAEYQYSKKELQFQRKTLQQRWLIFSAFAGLFSMGIIAFLVNRNRTKIKLANAELNRQNTLIEKQRAKLETAFSNLKSAQSQLIQSEKLASLGELTAGIAHEIQNPLNFVNNFSEVSHELLTEMDEELKSGNMEEVQAISSDVRQNLEKIMFHGKRAEAIVKGMLQHSRHGSGQKELTDINALADEYLRLAYHGLRAKDKSFNAKIETDLDPDVEKMELVPQDVGRVILNLINNAFYAVTEKKKSAEEGFEPTVSVSTKKENSTVTISVKDNGNGIPKKVLNKMFQPFFTTKPTGQGTGLGLSLSYDIVKAHGGEIKVETVEGKGTKFTIILPT